jgi:phage terminase large subunit
MRQKVTKNTLWLNCKPSARQTLFFEARSRYIAYGGARGGGKSWALRMKVILLSVEYPGIRILLIRRTIQELRENHIIPLRGILNGVATYNDDEKAFLFPNGSRLKLGYCDAEADVLQYQGQEYDIICMDEGTQFTEFQFTCLRACLRGGMPLHPKRFYITCNPGGVGHAWVKRLFIDQQYRGKEKKRDFSFIPAKVFDNDWLMKNDPDYLESLETIQDENLRRAWLNGEWDTFSGQYFTEFDKNIHVCKPIPIPSGWNKYNVIDYGLDALAGLWIAISPDNVAYVYREVFSGKDARDNNGLIVSEAANKIKSLETDEITMRIAPPDLWSRKSDSGVNSIEIFANHGLYYMKASNDRVPGWLALKEWMKVFDKDGKATARLQIFENCVNLIRCLPLMQYSTKDGNDTAAEPHDVTHLPDALRYWAISRPCATYVEPQEQPDIYAAFGVEEKSEGLFSGTVTEEYLTGGW